MRGTLIGGLILILSSLTPAHGAETTQPSTQPTAPAFTGAIVRLWPTDPPAAGPFDSGDKLVYRKDSNPPAFNLDAVQHPSLMVYPAQGTGPRAAVIICPGGGYRMESLTYEGIEIAEKFAADGVVAFVLRYRLPHGQPPAEGQLPVPQQDALRAIQLVRARAGEWNVDPKRIGIVGFSAGGHLAATAATLYDQAASLPAGGDESIAKASARPDFAVLMYPVISMSLPVTHGGSRQNLIGKEADAALEARFDPSQHVTPQTPPIWIGHAADDKAVPVENSEQLIAAAVKNKVPHALLLMSHGGHGFGLGNNPETKMWYAQCIAWMRGQKLID